MDSKSPQFAGFVALHMYPLRKVTAYPFAAAVVTARLI
jgi:hypothetical protein